MPETQTGPSRPENPNNVSDTRPEKEGVNPIVKIFIERHGRPHRPDDRPTDPDELNRIGKLDEEGVLESREAAKQMARGVLANGKPVTFFFLGSPSEYFIEGEAFGARGQHTAQESASAVQEVIDEQGLTPERADIHLFGKDDSGSRPHKNLGEPNYFYVNDSEDPMGYFNALVEKYGKDVREEAWLNVPENLEGVRTRVGAQSAPEVATRVMKVIKSVRRYAENFSKDHPGRELVFLMVTHGDIMRAVAQHGFGVSDEAKGYAYKMNEIMEIEASHNTATVKFNDKEYEVAL